SGAGGRSLGSCDAGRTEMVPPVASVVRSTLRSRPKALSGSARSGVTILACSDDLISSLLCFPRQTMDALADAFRSPADDAGPIVDFLSMPILYAAERHR